MIESCLSVSFTPVSPISGVFGGFCDVAGAFSRVGGTDATAALVGGISSYFSLVCDAGLAVEFGALRTLEGYILTLSGGYIYLRKV